MRTPRLEESHPVPLNPVPRPGWALRRHDASLRMPRIPVPTCTKALHMGIREAPAHHRLRVVLSSHRTSVMVAMRAGHFAHARDALSMWRVRKPAIEGLGAPLFSRSVAASV